MLAAGWEVAYSRSDGSPYYVNTHTQETQFEIPTAPARPAEDTTRAVAPWATDRALPAPAQYTAAKPPQPTAAKPGTVFTPTREVAAPVVSVDPELVRDAVQVAVQAKVARKSVFDQILGTKKDGRPLPRGWIRGRSEAGATLYIDTLNEKTTTVPPTRPARKPRGCCSSKPEPRDDEPKKLRGEALCLAWPRRPV